MNKPDAPDPTPPLLPAGHRWGSGSQSVAPYLRDVWAVRTSNPVFTPRQLAAVVWPAAKANPHATP